MDASPFGKGKDSVCVSLCDRVYVPLGPGYWNSACLYLFGSVASAVCSLSSCRLFSAACALVQDGFLLALQTQRVRNRLGTLASICPFSILPCWVGSWCHCPFRHSGLSDCYCSYFSCFPTSIACQVLKVQLLLAFAVLEIFFLTDTCCNMDEPQK